MDRNKIQCKELGKKLVVPYVGTWIEMESLPKSSQRNAVVPYVGTWIEIFR